MVVKKKSSAKKKVSPSKKKKTSSAIKPASAHPPSAKVVPLQFAKHWKIGAAVAGTVGAAGIVGGLSYHKRKDIKAFLDAIKELEKDDFTMIPGQIKAAGVASLNAKQQKAKDAVEKLKTSWNDSKVKKALGSAWAWVASYFTKKEEIKAAAAAAPAI